MAQANKIFAVHPGEILKTEFMEPMGVSAYALAKALGFPGIYDVVRHGLDDARQRGTVSQEDAEKPLSKWL